MLKKLLGNKVKTLRKAMGLSQEKLAEYIGLSMNSINRIESGTSFPKPENIERICEYFGIDYAELFRFDKQPNTDSTSRIGLDRYLSTFTEDDLSYLLDCTKAYAKLKRRSK